MPKNKFSLGKMLKKYRIAVAIALLIFSFLYYFRPWFHNTLMFLYKNPAFLEVLVVWLIFLKIFVFKNRIDIKTVLLNSGRIYASITILVFLLLLANFVSIYAPKLHLAKEIKYEKIQSLPETQENIRLMPFEVAYRIARDSLQLSQYKLGRGNMALIGENKTLSWGFPLVPDGFILQFILKNKGIVYVDATTQRKNTKMVWKDLSIGEGMQIFDNLFWNVYKKKYWIDVTTPYYIPVNNEIYTVVPVIKYEFHNYYGLLYTVPEFGGVFLIDSKGNMRFLSPEEALKNEILKDNWVFPGKLARTYVEAYNFRRGLINYFFIHKDQMEIKDISSFNRQPFLMYTSQGLQWFISTEPYGESFGIFKIFLVDARTGEIKVFEPPENGTLTGYIKARDFVRRANPLVDWNRFVMVEPLPFIKNSTLYWKIVVIPRDAAGIAYQAFVNAKTNEVIELESEEAIKKFIETGEVKANKTYEKPSRKEIVKEIRKKLEEIGELLKELE